MTGDLEDAANSLSHRHSLARPTYLDQIVDILNTDTTSTAKVPVIVGGSDGSGTRAFVELLAKLGVVMLLDDPVSLDISGATLCDRQGWPPLAKLALTHRTFPIHTWPEAVRNQSQFEMTKLRKLLDMRFIRKIRKLAVLEHIDSSQLASKVLYGFKAPITMVLLPMIQAHLYPNGFKYIHVVRDGRDISLSSNQSPVKKFYTSTYHHSHNNNDGNDNNDAALARIQEQQRRNTTLVLAMQLWNDWNVNLYEWAMNATTKSKTSASSSSSNNNKNNNNNFEYLVVRSEDFLNPETKFQALQVLANFVGSPLTVEQLCCLSRQNARDMGQSHSYNYIKNQTSITSTTVQGGMLRDKNLLNGRVPARDRASKSRAGGAKTMTMTTGRSVHHRRLLLSEDRPRRRRLFELELLERHSIPVHKGQWTPGAHGRNRTVSQQQASDTTKIVIDMHNAAAARAGQHGVRRRLPIQGRGSRGIPPPLDYGDEALGKLMMEELQDLVRKQQTVSNQNRSVAQRYGKWSYLLEPNSTLSLLLHAEGARGLQIFGYEPRRNTMYAASSSSSTATTPEYHGYTCSAADAVSCPENRRTDPLPNVTTNTASSTTNASLVVAG